MTRPPAKPDRFPPGQWVFIRAKVAGPAPYLQEGTDIAVTLTDPIGKSDGRTHYVPVAAVMTPADVLRSVKQ